ncbi:unnamed protein product [Brugia pahangi]|uniref:Reverse transcriptase domain-containing protein n=1 Tax=Brugia pahangi TaxID=6280 RepID=A0A0N4T7G2_BRUPA|nr:unnamed protein product [Brugia pahangi]
MQKCFQSVYTGFAVREMAFDLFGATRTSPHFNVVMSFQNSLLLSGFPLEILDRWDVCCTSGLLDDIVITPKLQAMLTKKFALVAGSKTLDEAQRILEDLNIHLTNLITKSGTRALIHDAITKLCDRATEVELRFRMDIVSVRDVEEMLKVVRREKDLLVGLGRSMHDNICDLLFEL